MWYNYSIDTIILYYMTTYDKEYYLANKEKLSKNQLKWNKKNAEKLALYAQQYAFDNPRKIMLALCKQRASLKGLEFSLTEEDFVFPETCPYLGMSLTYIRGKGRQKTNYSVDRIDSTKGYVKGNIQIISDLANRMKQEATPEQLVTFAKNIFVIHKDLL